MVKKLKNGIVFIFFYMFIKVNRNNLVVREKYMIKSKGNTTYYTGNFHEHVGWDCQLFSNVVYHGSTKIEHGFMYMEYSKFKKIHYYALVPQKERIQKAMEQRALDTILKRLINDDFTW
jgi:hypothetical protein